jgi:hypothetical protein
MAARSRAFFAVSSNRSCSFVARRANKQRMSLFLNKEEK